MPPRTDTRERILDAAECLVLEGGFSAMSIEKIMEAVQITKGGFFYHFKSKDDLARALVERYGERDTSLVQSMFERADTLSDDPLERMLIFLKLYEESTDKLYLASPGCLFASFSYEIREFSDDIGKFIREGFLAWRQLTLSRLEEIARQYPPTVETDLPELADMFMCTVEGGLLMSRTLGQEDILPRQVAHYRRYLRMIFRP